MPIRVTLDEMLARRGMRAREIAAIVGISETQMSLFRSGKVKGIRFRTLAKLCAVLECTPGDLLGYDHDPGDLQLTTTASVLPDPPKPLALRPSQTDGMTDYLGVVQTRAPATIALKLTAVRSGARADIATTAELQPR